MQNLSQAALDAGLDPSLAPFASRYVQIESGGDPNAQTGSYTGALQMGPDERAKYGGNGVTNGLSMYADNQNWFKNKYGRLPSPTELYMTAQQGQGGVANHMANPDTPAWQNMYATAEGQKKGAGWAKKAIWGNVPDDLKAQFPGGVDSLTSQQFMNLWQHKVERTPMQMAMNNNTGRTTMADPNTPALSAQFAGGPGAMYGGQPSTPLGMFGGLLRQLGVGSDNEIGRKLQNAGAGLIAVGNPSGGAALQNAANMPMFRQNFSVYTDPYGRQGVLNHKTGQVNMFGQNVGGSSGSDGSEGDASTFLANTPNALKERSKLETENTAKKIETLRSESAAAQARINQNEYLTKLSQDPGVLQGPGLWNMIKESVSKNTNGAFGGVDLGKQGEFNKQNAALVASNLGSQPGIRFAAPEIKFGQTMSADHEYPAATNQQIYSMNIQNDKRVIKAHEIAERHLKQYGTLGARYSKELSDWNDANPVFQGDAIQPNSGPSAPGGDAGFKVIKVH